MTDTAATRDEAVRWHLRARDLTDDEWPAFVDWLDAPANARAYDAVASADRLLDEVRGALSPAVRLAPPVPSIGRARVRRWAWAGSAVAAGLAVVVGVPMLRTGAQPWTIETRPGELRRVDLADGTRIELNGATRLVLDRRNTRTASLEAGEAVFHVRHDAARPFTLVAGDLTIRDLGTVFDVAQGAGRTDIAVAEGSVAVQPGAAQVVLTPGRSLSAANGAMALGRVSPATVGGWRSGTLSFAGAPLGSVTAALERRSGARIALLNGLPARSFSGTIRLNGSAERDIPHFAALIGAGWHREGERWLLEPKGAGTR